jgi:predicted Zn-dependent protease
MKNKINFFAIFVLLFASISCRSIDLNFFPDSYDLKLGAQFDEDIKKNPKEYPILAGRDDVRKYVTDIGNKILSSPEIKKRNEFVWKFEIIDDDSTINAFCVPGGYVYVYTGILKFLDDEATLAGVIAHEIAHAEKRHSTRRIVSQLGVQLGVGYATELLLGKNAASWQQVVVPLLGDMLSSGLVMHNSREDESESDEYSFKYLKSTEYYPGAINGFFEKMEGTGKTSSGIEAKVQNLFSTHPLSSDRLDNINKLIKAGNYPPPGEHNLFKERYTKFKKTLK